MMKQWPTSQELTLSSKHPWVIEGEPIHFLKVTNYMETMSTQVMR